ncbi:MAG: 5'-methylthioadenosine/S-adenosylhomocysteine nucleosidase, partial [Clostridium sp.]|nr:5'-methylthioadenosine/S-adenosylhomocysteine nucleosidase [Clostridium sp.]
IYINSDNHLVNLSKKILKNNNYTFYTGTIASGDIFCTDKKQSNKIANEFEALCVEMEGASIAQVCHLCHIPFLVIRCISDVPNNNNVITYEEFLDISSQKIALVLKKIIEEV